MSKDSNIIIRLESELKDKMEELANLRSFSNLSSMIRHDYTKFILKDSDLIDKEEFFSEFFPTLRKMLYEIIESQKDIMDSEEEEENDEVILVLLEFLRDYILTDESVLSSLYFKWKGIEKKKDMN